MLKLKNNARDIRVPKTTVTPIPQKLDSEPFFHTLFFFGPYFPEITSAHQSYLFHFNITKKYYNMTYMISKVC